MFEGKDRAILLDHAGNSNRHGLPDDPREWSLLGREANVSAKNPVMALRTCEHCFAVARAFATVCPECGRPFKVTPRVVEQVDGELSEVDRDALRLKRVAETYKASGLEQLIELGIRRGYKAPERWALHVHAARKAKKQKRVDLNDQGA
jgi:hypothetical protein